MNKTLYLHLEPHDISPESGATVQIQLGDKGIVAEAWSLDDCIAYCREQCLQPVRICRVRARLTQGITCIKDTV